MGAPEYWMAATVEATATAAAPATTAAMECSLEVTSNAGSSYRLSNARIAGRAGVGAREAGGAQGDKAATGRGRSMESGAGEALL